MSREITNVVTMLIVTNVYIYKADALFWSKSVSTCRGNLTVQRPVYVDRPVTLEFEPETYGRDSTIQWRIQTGGVLNPFSAWTLLENSTKYAMHNADDGSMFSLEVAGDNETKLHQVYVEFYKDGTTKHCYSDTVRFKRKDEIENNANNTSNSNETISAGQNITDEDVDDNEQEDNSTTTIDEEANSHIDNNDTWNGNNSDIQENDYDYEMNPTTNATDTYETASSQRHFVTSPSSSYSTYSELDASMPSSSEPTTAYEEIIVQTSTDRPNSEATESRKMNIENITVHHRKINTHLLNKKFNTKSYQNNGYENYSTTNTIKSTEDMSDYSSKQDVTDKYKVENKVIKGSMNQSEVLSDENTFNFQWIIVGGVGGVVFVLAIAIVAVIVVKRKRKAEHRQSAEVGYVACGKHEDNRTGQNGSANGNMYVDVCHGMNGDRRRPTSNGRQSNRSADQLPQVYFNLQPQASTAVPR